MGGRADQFADQLAKRNENDQFGNSEISFLVQAELMAAG
jgi:hypothetical protein